MALVGGGTLGTRTHLLGEWSDVASLFNACDLVCSSALNDSSRMTLVMAMLCGVPCVATGMGAQGEVIGQFGVAIEPGSPAAFVKGITRVMQLTPEKRAHMAQGARKHALEELRVRALAAEISAALLRAWSADRRWSSRSCRHAGIDATVAASPPRPRARHEASAAPITHRRPCPIRIRSRLRWRSSQVEQLPNGAWNRNSSARSKEAELAQLVSASQTSRRRAAGVRGRAGEADH